MARPLTGGASSLAHVTIDRLDEEEPTTTTSGPERDAATAVGSLVHRVLEKVDLVAGLSQRLPAALEEASAELDLTLDESTAASAREWLSSLTRTLAGGSCIAKLSGLASRIIGREIAIIAPPDPDRGPVGALTGFVDLVYRDPDDGRVVVADYKTDHVDGEEAIAERTGIYEPQVRTYARALREALNLDHEPHVELWFLAADRIVRL
jgi:ATP-dependent exoDNAse (exonuclease V) beta subunit